MSSLTRTTVFLAPAVILALFEIVYQKPAWIFFIGALTPFLMFSAVFLIMGPGLKTPVTRLKFLIAPTFMTWSALAFSLLVERSLLRHLLAVVVAIFLILFLESIVTYIWRHEAYEGYSLENLTAYALLLTVFLGSSVMLGMRVLLDINFFVMAILFLVMIVGVNYKLFWVSKLPVAAFFRFAAVLTIVLFELFVSLTFLPFHFMVSGALTTVSWYIAASVSRAHLLNLLTPKMVYRHLSLGLILTLLLLASARWV